VPALTFFKINLFMNQHHCSYCGRKLRFKQATVDHIIPLSRGGKTCYDNLCIACQRCNNLKGDLPMEAFESLLISKGIVKISN
jgi:5-methylcytosine-specific restriction endonuclease McrA